MPLIGELMTDGNGPLKSKGSYNADFLGQVLYDLYTATTIVAPRSSHFSGLLQDQKLAVTTLHTRVACAIRDASTAIQSEFSSQFLSSNQLKPGEYDRPYLQNGYRPTVQEMADCICCNHPFCDEPNSNRTAVENNRQARATHLAQLASDQRTWDAGGTVYNQRGTAMQRGRKRNDPKYEVLLINCHCPQFGCTTREGAVPEKECPIRCIDPATGSRYGTDPMSGDCLCLICQCNDCPRFFTVSYLLGAIHHPLIICSHVCSNLLFPVVPTTDAGPSNVQG